MNLLFLDTETTGLSEADRLCQLAFRIDNYVCNELFSTGIPINIGAMSAHHITEEMIKNKPKFQESPYRKTLENLLSDDKTILVAHNAKFDIGMLRKEGLVVPKHICTLKVSRYLFENNPEVEKHNLQYLRYYFNIPDKAIAHDALGDIIILEKVFDKLYDVAKKKAKKGSTREQILKRMIEISTTPQTVRKMPFGKYKGWDIIAIFVANRGYLEWLHKDKQWEPGDELELTIRNLISKK